MSKAKAPSVRTPPTLLQRVVFDKPYHLRSLYWNITSKHSNHAVTEIEQTQARLSIPAYATVAFDAYFNIFFEAIWRKYTLVKGITLQLKVDGPCVVRVTRRNGQTTQVCCEHIVSEANDVALVIADEGLHFRQYGLLSFEVSTDDKPADFISGAWFADVNAPVICLSAVLCTLNRETNLGAILDSIAADADVVGSLAHVFVVNQGKPNLRHAEPIVRAAFDLGEKLTIIDQKNFGGAGGFGRGLLEAIDAETTHVILLDDDIILEPDSIIRMAAFFALSRSDVIVGGQMLDSMTPTILYESGAVISERHWSFQPQHHGCDLSKTDALIKLSDPLAIHYNGWWCCGIPLSIVRHHGMPLPCFIRGDDMEYGLRLHQAGIATVAVPGIAVWHEPFYLKTGSWHLYYETRNLLIAAALHLPMRPQEVTRRMARQLAMSLLTFRYYDAALIIQGISDFLTGPDGLKLSPQGRHASLNTIKQRYPSAVTTRQVVLEKQVLKRAPRSTFSFIVTLVWLIIVNTVSASRPAPPRLLQVKDLAWPRMRGVERVAVETWWDEALPTFYRSRKDFRKLAAEAVRTLLRLYRLTPALVQQWQASLPLLTSQQFWRDYLELNKSGLKIGDPEMLQVSESLSNSVISSETIAS